MLNAPPRPDGLHVPMDSLDLPPFALANDDHGSIEGHVAKHEVTQQVSHRGLGRLGSSISAMIAEAKQEA